MLYTYVDESFRQVDGDWHAAVGGLLVPSHDAVNLDLALLESLRDLEFLSQRERQSEFKSADFFRAQPDEMKAEVLRALTAAIESFDAHFVIAHAMCESERLSELGPFHRSPQEWIQFLAYVNLPQYLAPVTAEHVVQLIVDLGIQESFRPVYEMYVGLSRGVSRAKLMGIADSNLTVPNLRSFPVPAFVDSRDSRTLQFCDVVVGITLAEASGSLSGFKRQLAEALSSIRDRIEVHSVKWKLDGSSRRT